MGSVNKQLVWAAGLDTSGLESDASKVQQIFQKLIASGNEAGKVMDEIFGKSRKMSLDDTDVKSVINSMTAMQKKIDEASSNQVKINIKSDDVNQATDAINKLKEKIGDVGNYKITSTVNTGAAAMKDQIAGVSNAISGMNDRMSRAADTLIGLFAVDKVRDFMMQVVNVSAEFERLEVTMDVLFKSASEGHRVMSELTQFSLESPFQVRDLGNAAKQLAAFGISSKDIVPTVKMLGQASAALNVPIRDIGLAYGKINTEGQLYSRNLYQFTNKGIPLLQVLADQFGKTTAETKKMITAGQVGFPEVQRAFIDMTSEGGIFGGVIARTMETVSGQITILKDNITLMFNKIGKENSGVIRDAVQMLISLAKNAGTYVTALEGLVAMYGAYKVATLSVVAAQTLENLVGTQGITIQVDSQMKKIAQIATNEALAASEGEVAAATEAANLTLTINPYVAAAVAVAGLSFAIYQWAKSTDPAIAAQKTTNALLDQSSAKMAEFTKGQGISNLIDKYMKLTQAVKEGKDKNDQLADTTSRLSSMMPQLIDHYDKYGNAVLVSAQKMMQLNEQLERQNRLSLEVSKSDNYAQRSKLENQIAELKKELETAPSSQTYTPSVRGMSVPMLVSNGRTKADIQKDIESISGQIKDLTNKIREEEGSLYGMANGLKPVKKNVIDIAAEWKNAGDHADRINKVISDINKALKSENLSEEKQDQYYTILAEAQDKLKSFHKSSAQAIKLEAERRNTAARKAIDDQLELEKQAASLSQSIAANTYEKKVELANNAYASEVDKARKTTENYLLEYNKVRGLSSTSKSYVKPVTTTENGVSFVSGFSKPTPSVKSPGGDVINPQKALEDQNNLIIAATNKRNSDIENANKEHQAKMAEIDAQINHTQLSGLDKEINDINERYRKLTKEVQDNFKEGSDDYNNEMTKIVAGRKKDLQEAADMFTYKASDFYVQAFGDISNYSNKALRDTIDLIQKVMDGAKQSPTKNDSGETVFTLMIPQAQGAAKETKLTAAELVTLQKQLDKIQKDYETKSPFASIVDDLDKIKNPDKNTDKNTDIYASLIKDTSNAKAKVDALGDAFGSVFGTKVGSDIKNVSTALSAMGTMAAGIGQLASGDIIEGLTNVIGSAGKLFNLFKSHHKSLVDQVAEVDDKIKSVLTDIDLVNKSLASMGKGPATSSLVSVVSQMDSLKTSVTNLSREIGHQLGSNKQWAAYVSGLGNPTNNTAQMAYVQQLNAKTEALSNSLGGLFQELNSGLLNDDQKKAIENTLSSYNDLIAAKNEIIKDITGTSVTDLSNSLVSAFESGINAANEWGKTVEDVIKHVAEQALIQSYITKPMQQAIDDLTANESGGFNADAVAKFKKAMSALYATATPELQQMADMMQSIGIDLFSTSSGLSGAISASLSEETAGILEGIWRNSNDMIHQQLGLSQSMLDNLVLIARNTASALDYLRSIDNKTGSSSSTKGLGL